MKYCSHCGSQLNENDQFCMDCGSPVNKVDQAVASQSIASINSGQKKNPSKNKLVIGALIAVIILTGGIWFGIMKQNEQTPTSTSGIVGDVADTVKEKLNPNQVQSEKIDSVPNIAAEGRQALNPQTKSSPVIGSFKSVSGSGYFIDPFSKYDDKCTFDIDAQKTAVGVAVNLEFRDPLYYDARPIKITANDIAKEFDLKIIPGSTECLFSVTGTYQIGNDNPVIATIHLTVTDTDVDTFQISIPEADWQVQKLAGGSIVIKL